MVLVLVLELNLIEFRQADSRLDPVGITRKLNASTSQVKPSRTEI